MSTPCRRAIARFALHSAPGVLASLPLAAQEPHPSGDFAPRAEEPVVVPDRQVAFEGFAYTPAGAPAEGAVVVTSAGGQAAVDAAGRYLVEARVPLDAETVQVTVLGRGAGRLVATARVDVSPPSLDPVPVDPLLLTPSGTCPSSWLPTFGGEPGMNGGTLAFSVYDDGGGPALYAGGSFSYASGELVFYIARWNGSSWSALGSGMNGGVDALTVYDDGGGSALYAGGGFTTAGGQTVNGVARWDGASWSALGSGMGGLSSVRALAVYDDGFGPALFAGGTFQSAGGVTARHIARWDGTSWSGVGIGVPLAAGDSVHALAVHDDGNGPALYLGGDFTTVAGMAASNVVRWNGASWSALGSGLNDEARALIVYDDGGGPALHAAGFFTTAGGSAANYVARWNGTSWSALGSGTNGAVFDLSVYDDGGGPALHAGGFFTTAGGLAANRIASWNGTSWSALGSGMNGNVHATVGFDDGSGSALFAGGFFTTAGGVVAHRIARWDGTSWSALGNGLDNWVRALTVFDDGGGPALYAGGDFISAGGVATVRIGCWDGTSWSALGSGTNHIVLAMSEYDDGGGPALYAGGQFTTAGGVAANHIARWDGTSWSAVGSGMSVGESTAVRALAVYDDGSGPALYAGGQFTTAGGVAANHIARWDGTSWSALGSGNGGTNALIVHDDGSGAALYAACGAVAGGVTVNGIARWDGTSWSALGSGITSAFATVSSLAVYDDGGGPALYVGGEFTTAGGVAVNGIARWDGMNWSALGSMSLGAEVLSLAVHDDGSGLALFAGGFFSTASGVTVRHIARWDGTDWSPLGAGLSTTVRAMVEYDDGSGSALYVGGLFESALDSADSFLAKWGCDITPPVLSCPSSVTALDGFPGGIGEAVSFSVTATDEVDDAPVVTCSPPSGSIFPPGTTLVTCTATDATGNQSTCQFPVVVERKAKRH